MCGRYGFVPTKDFYKRFGVETKLERLEPNYNAAPGQIMPVITRHSPNQLEMMRWGLVPFWAKDPKIGFKTINARYESLLDKPSFRKPMKTGRCIVPASGYYEWKGEGKEKQPYYFRKKNLEMISFAGLYDIWKDAEGRPMKTYSIITVPANKEFSDVHERMPAILNKEEEEIWIDNNANPADLAYQILKTVASKDFEFFPVSFEVNKPANNFKSLIDPLNGL